MSITLVTDGMLWPIAGIIREQFTDIEYTIIDPYPVTSVVEEIDEIVSAAALVTDITFEIAESDIESEVEAINVVSETDVCDD